MWSSFIACAPQLSSMREHDVYTNTTRNKTPYTPHFTSTMNAGNQRIQYDE